MNFETLHAFAETARLENITMAAQKLHVAQPALSRTILRLEAELDCRLFDRRGKQIFLNDSGRIFLHAADSILRQYDNALTQLQEANAHPDPAIRLCVASAGAYIGKVISLFKQSFPDTMFHISNTPEELDCRQHFVLYCSYPGDPADHAVRLGSEPLFLAMSDADPRCSQPGIRLRDCVDDNLLFFEPTNSMYTIQQHYCRLCGLRPEIQVQTNKNNILLSLAAAGEGVLLVPKAATVPAGAVLMPILDCDCRRVILLQQNHTVVMTERALAFEKFLVRFFREELGGAS